MDVQVEKAYQKQTQIHSAKSAFPLAVYKKGKQTQRFVQNIGLGFKTPDLALKGDYIDKKCPWTGTVHIRGRILKGKVMSTKMKRTVVVRKNYLHYIPKYKRFEKRHSNIIAHCSPAISVKEGDEVTIGECRPLSKTIRFNVIRVDKAAGGKKGFKPF